MSLLCIGATKHYPNNTTEDLADDFIRNEYVMLTYDPVIGATLYETLNQAAAGTPIVIKSFSVQHGLYIKAFGLIADQPNTQKLTSGRKVKWVWKGNKHFGKLNDKLDCMRSAALYYEANTHLITLIVNLIFWKFRKPKTDIGELDGDSCTWKKDENGQDIYGELLNEDCDDRVTL